MDCFSFCSRIEMWFEQEKNSITLFNEAGVPGPEVRKLELVMRLEIEMPDMKGSVTSSSACPGRWSDLLLLLLDNMLEREMWMDRMIYTWVSEDGEMYFVFLSTHWEEISQQSIIRFWELTFKFRIFLQKLYIYDIQTNGSVRFAGRCYGFKTLPTVKADKGKVKSCLTITEGSKFCCGSS